MRDHAAWVPKRKGWQAPTLQRNPPSRGGKAGGGKALILIYGSREILIYRLWLILICDTNS